MVLDLDGTILHPDKRLAHGAADLVERARRMGVVTLIATARPPRSTCRFVKRLKPHPLTVNYNGAVVWDTQAGRVVHHVAIGRELVEQVRLVARDDPRVESLNYEVLDRWFFEPLRDGARLDVNDTARAGFAPDLVGELPSFTFEAATKIMPYLPGGGAHELADRLAGRFGEALYVVCTGDDLVQISAAGVNKADALERILGDLGLDWSGVLAAGDNRNDLAMLRRAAHSVAPATSVEEVLALTTEIAEGPEGVIERIGEWLEGQPPTTGPANKKPIADNR